MYIYKSYIYIYMSYIYIYKYITMLLIAEIVS